MPGLVKLADNLPANEPRCSGDQDSHVPAGSLASSSPTSLTSGAIVFWLNSNLQPAAAKSSGKGREPPSAKACLYCFNASALLRLEFAQTCKAPSCAIPYSM